MQEAGAGNQNAFRALASELGHPMHHRAMRLMGQQKHFADDAVQNALIKIWQNAPRWCDSGSVEGYVYRIIYHECMNIYRKHKDWVALDDQISVGDNTNEKIQEFQDKQVLSKALKKLNDPQKMAVILYYFQECSLKQTAEMMQKTEKAVESIIVRARIKLRKILPKDFYQERFRNA